MGNSEVYKGKIVGFKGSWGSGIGYLMIEDSDLGTLLAVPCDNGATVRALECAFGNVIGDGHTVKEDGGYVGKEIFWGYDEFGLVMAGFTPVEMASEELVKAYINTHIRG